MLVLSPKSAAVGIQFPKGLGRLRKNWHSLGVRVFFEPIMVLSSSLQQSEGDLP